jgi:uncharacterized LabA/DUF88 family protein
MNWAGYAFGQVTPWTNLDNWFGISIGAAATLLAVTLLVALHRNRQLRTRLSHRTLEEDLLARAVITSRAARTRIVPGVERPPTGTSARPTPTRVTPEQLRVKIFVDGSNLLEDLRKLAPKGLNVDWNRLPKDLLEAFAALPIGSGKTVVYCGTNVYGSYFGDDYYALLLGILNGTAKNVSLPFQSYKRSRIEEAARSQLSSANDDRVLQAQVKQRLLEDIEEMSAENAALRRDFASLATKFGYFPFIFERITPPDLYRARYTSDGVPLAREKRVDVQLCADLMADASFDMYDVAMLVSCDTDFIPAIDFVRQEMHRDVVQVGHPHFSETIRKSCSDHISLADLIARASAATVSS